MSRKITKSDKAKKRKKAQNARIKKMEAEDSKGISRRKLTWYMNPKVFIILKIISIILIPLMYFLYSPLLMVCVLFSALTMAFAVMTERKINHTFIKANHMKILKLDGIIAILLFILTIAGAIISLNTSKHMPFNDTWMTFRKTMENIGSCLTGNRSFVHKSMGMGFGTHEMPPNMPSMSGGHPPKMEDLSITDLPVEAVFSMMISSLTSVMLFAIPVFGILTLVLYFLRKRKFDREMNEVITEKSEPISDELFDELFMFGYENIKEETNAAEQL